jgi:hypothetical protein
LPHHLAESKSSPEAIMNARGLTLSEEDQLFVLATVWRIVRNDIESEIEMRRCRWGISRHESIFNLKQEILAGTWGSPEPIHVADLSSRPPSALRPIALAI